MGFSTPGNWLQSKDGNGGGGEIATGVYVLYGTTADNLPLRYVGFDDGYGRQNAITGAEIRYPGCRLDLERTEYHKPTEEYLRQHYWRSYEHKQNFKKQHE